MRISLEIATGFYEIITMSLNLSKGLIAQPLEHIRNLYLIKDVFPHPLKIVNYAI